MLSLIIIKFITNKEYYNKYINIIKNLTLEKEVKELTQLIGVYYKQYPNHDYISKDELKIFFDKEYPTKKNKELYSQLIDQVYTLDTSSSLAADVLKQLVEIDYANQIVQHLLPTISGDQFGLMRSVDDLLVAFRETTEQTDEDEEDKFVEDNLRNLLDAKDVDGLQWRLGCLRRALGRLPGGTLGHIFARPESGKTTMVHSEVSHFVTQLENGDTVLWVNNEEPGKTIKLRFYSAVTGMTEHEIRQNPEEALNRYDAGGGRRMHLYDCATLSVEELHKMMQELRPRIVIIDQSDKLSYRGISHAGNGAERLKQIHDRLRVVVKACNNEWRCDIITVGQADAAAEGQKWLTLNNLDSGKTGKPGAFDYIIGIGHAHEPGQEMTRYISFCKNKLTGDHSRHVVAIDPLTARYID